MGMWTQCLQLSFERLKLVQPNHSFWSVTTFQNSDTGRSDTITRQEFLDILYFSHSM